jgi:signal transduction histidine kinase
MVSVAVPPETRSSGLPRDRTGGSADRYVRELEEAGSTAASWIRAEAGPDAAAAISLPDASGRLRVVWSDADIGFARNYGARRRAFETSRPALVRLRPNEERALAVVPLGRGEQTVGVLEVVGSHDAIATAWDRLQDLADLLGFAMSNASQLTKLRREVGDLERASRLGVDLADTYTPEAASGVAVRFLFERFRLPVAGWCGWEDGPLLLTAMRGVTSAKRRELRRSLDVVPRWGSAPEGQQQDVIRRFRTLLGVREVGVIDAGDALLLVADPRPPMRVSFEVVGVLLGGALRQIAVGEAARRRSEELDIGLAWTAHEFRAPVLGVKAVLETLLSDHLRPESRQMLSRSVTELEQLAELIDGLLEWAVGAGRLRRRRADLARVVRESVEAGSFELGTDRVFVDAPDHLLATIDPPKIRAAIANLVRNALSYSPADTDVYVGLRSDGSCAKVVVRDEGAGIPDAERERIFDPFVRGRAARGVGGSGLGLFVARRVVEAHRGVIGLEPAVSGTSFMVELPL